MKRKAIPLTPCPGYNGRGECEALVQPGHVCSTCMQIQRKRQAKR